MTTNTAVTSMSVASILGLDPELYPLLDSTQDGIVILDPGFRILFVSDSFLQMTGRGRDEYILKTPPFPHWPPELVDRYMGAWSEDWEADPAHHATLLLRANGDRFRARVHSFTIKGESGNAVAHLVAFKDLDGPSSEFVDSLKTGWRQVRLIADSVPVILSYVDRDLCYRFTNKEHARILAYDVDHIEGKSVREVLGEERFESAEPCLLRALQGETVDFTSEILLAGGGVSHVRGTCTPDRDADGSVVGVFVSASDVTEIVRAKQQSESNAELLVATNKAVRVLFENGAEPEEIHRAFTEVAKCIHADRFCFCRMEPLPGGGLRAVKHKVWNSTGKAGKEPPSVDFSKDSPILGHLVAGQSVQRRRSEANEEDAAIFAKVDALSFVTVPVFFDDQLWGLLKYDDNQSERTWSQAEIKALELASQTIGAALRDRELQAEIHRVTRQYRDLADNAPFCIHELDCDGVFRAISEWGFCALGSKCEEDVVGTSIRKHVHVDDWPHYAQRLKEAALGRYCKFEFRLLTPEGYLMTETTMIPIHGTDGKVSHIMGTTADISARKNAEREAATMRKRLDRAESASNVMRCFVGLDSTWKSVPTRLCELLGYTREELLATTCAALTHPDDIICEKKLKEPVLNREADSFEMEKRFIRKDGVPVWVYLGGTMMRNERDQDDQWLAYIRDISAEKTADEALRKSKQELRGLAKRLQNVREEDSTRISREVHDELGQSLTALKMDIGWIDRRVQRDEENPAFRKKLDSMYEMIDKTIEHVREISTSLRPPILDDLGIAGALEQLVVDFSRHTHCRFHKGHELEALCATRDQATAIYRIVQEVLTNIIRHAKAQEVVIEVDCSSPGGVLLTIRDDGVGFDETKLTQNEKLGIVGMRERAVVFGGEVQFEAANGAGTLVTIHIPLNRMETA